MLWSTMNDWRDLKLTTVCNSIQGLYALSGKKSYYEISWNLQAERFGFRLFQSLRHLTDTSTASLRRTVRALIVRIQWNRVTTQALFMFSYGFEFGRALLQSFTLAVAQNWISANCLMYHIVVSDCVPSHKNNSYDLQESWYNQSGTSVIEIAKLAFRLGVDN